MAPRGAELHAAVQIVVEQQIAKGLLAAGFGQRRFELRTMDPADLASGGADAEPVGVTQLDLDPFVALGDEEDREAATRSGVQLDVGVGDLQALSRRVGRVRWCRDERARDEARKGDRPYPVRPEPQPVRPEPFEGLRQAQPEREK